MIKKIAGWFIGRKLKVIAVGVVLSLVVGGHYAYKNHLKKDIVSSLEKKKGKNDAKSINESKKIDADVDGLSDDAVDYGLREYFRTDDGEREGRLQDIPGDSTQYEGYSRNKETGTSAQFEVQKPMQGCSLEELSLLEIAYPFGLFTCVYDQFGENPRWEKLSQ